VLWQVWQYEVSSDKARFGRQGGHGADNELSLGRQGIVGCRMAI
jgi:hypothetical protein